ncbi:putative rapamycin-insensitive companion of mTOR [Apostichopus japonicus]|uniref:Putative rapamycin-insensitive companion of mTOR n=1 Tax=Stichopus japonicus TaxID=307972 RepID=A0A2G8LH73_STIJA|nr:putative rapamycin-insensitive companion of mTOR [Apostichopus japonicus]
MQTFSWAKTCTSPGPRYRVTRGPSPLPANRVSRQDRNSGSDQLPGIQEVSNGTGSKNLKEKTAQQKLKCVIQLKRAKTMPSIEGSLNGLKTSEAVMKIRSNSDASSRLTKDKANSEVRFSPESGNGRSSDQQSRDRSLSLKRRCDSNESGRGSIGTKSRSESFATDTTTQSSGVSSLHSNPSSPPIESSFSSLSTVASSHTVKSIHSSDALRKSHNLSRTPSYLRRLSKPIVIPQTPTSGKVVETSAVFTSSRDAHGYAALKALETQRQAAKTGTNSGGTHLWKRTVSTGPVENQALYTSDRSQSALQMLYYPWSRITRPRDNPSSPQQFYTAPNDKLPHRYPLNPWVERGKSGVSAVLDITLPFSPLSSPLSRGQTRSPPTKNTSVSAYLSMYLLYSILMKVNTGEEEALPGHPLRLLGMSLMCKYQDQLQTTLLWVAACCLHLLVLQGPKSRGDSRWALLVDEENERHHPETCVRCTKVRAVSSLDMEKEDCRSRSASECDMLSEYDARPRALSATSGRGTPTVATHPPASRQL